PSSPLFLLNTPAPPAIYTLSLHDALPICQVYNQKIKPKCNGIRLVNVGGISPRPTEVPSRTCHYERVRNLLPICYHAFIAPALRRISETNPWSFNDSRLMSTFANAPSIAARARRSEE